MKVGIMQPYLFPYIGYFSLISYVDEFVIFDTPQYISKGWVNRNRVLRQDGKIGYITVPIHKASQHTSIKDIKIFNDVDWKSKILGQVMNYKKKAPYFEDVFGLLQSILNKEYRYLVDLNIESIQAVCSYLGIKKNFKVYSKMDIEISSVKYPDEWALQITKEIGGSVYVNLPGGQSFFDKKKYKKNSIILEFLQSNLPTYIQRIGHFEGGLSIIDVMMFCSIKEIGNMLNDFNIIR